MLPGIIISMSSRKATPAPAKAAKPRSGASQRRAKFTLMPTVSTPAVLDGPKGGDQKFRQLLYDISIAAAHLESARGYLAARLGVTSPQYNMLMIIAQYQGDEGISVNDIAGHLHVSGTFVTTEVKKLERLSLLLKAPNPADARSVLIRLSEEGEQAVTALHSELLFVNDQLFESISAADFQALSRIIASLIGNFSRTVAALQVAAQSGDEAATVAQALKRSFKRPR